MSPETILLTGGTGFLGSHLMRRLLDEGHSLVLLKRSFSDLSRVDGQLQRVTTFDVDRGSLDQLFGQYPFSSIIHCATNYGRREPDPIAIVEANLILPLKLLELASKHGVRAFINTDTILDKRTSAYSLSKRQFSEWMMSYSLDLHCINIALEHFYGPHDNPSKFVSMIMGEILSKSPGIDLTAGEQKRDFIFVDDVVEAFVRILNHSQPLTHGLTRYEVGTGNSIQIRRFVEMVKDLSGNLTTELRFGALPYRENEIMESKVNTSALTALGWSPQTSLHDGIQRTLRSELERNGST